MIGYQAVFFKKLHLAGDILLTVASFFLAFLTRRYLLLERFGSLYPLQDYLWMLVVIAFCWWLLLSSHQRCYRYGARDLPENVKGIFSVVLKGSALLLAVLFFTQTLDQSRLLLALFVLFNLGLLLGARIILWRMLRLYRLAGKSVRDILLVGSGEIAVKFLQMLEEHSEWKMRVTDIMDWDEARIGTKVRGYTVSKPLSQLLHVLENNRINQVVFAINYSLLNKITESLRICESMGVQSSLLLDIFPDRTIAKMRFGNLGGMPCLTYSTVPGLSWEMGFKYAMDRIGAFALLVLFAPLMITTALLIKLTSRGPVFFTQSRCGLNGKFFKFYKFRSMHPGADKLQKTLLDKNEMTGPVFKIKDDPRVTPIGKVIRKLSIDELPQLFNVLKGDMSLVGPRPPLPEELAQYETWQRRRLSMKPGITCFWQTSGRSLVSFDEWMKSDLEYIDRWSLWLDIKLLFKTIPAVLMGRGAT